MKNIYGQTDIDDFEFDPTPDPELRREVRKMRNRTTFNENAREIRAARARAERHFIREGKGH